VNVLRRRLDELSARFHDAVADETLREEIGPPGEALLARIARLFEQQPLERQEIHVALRQLGFLLDTPDDDMVPTRREFCSHLTALRRALQNMARQAKHLLEEGAAGQGEPPSPALCSEAEHTLHKANHYLPQLARLEADGLRAHEQRDRKTWSNIQDDLAAVEHHVRELPALEELPTFLTKLLALRDLQREFGHLQEQSRKLESKGVLQEWIGQVERIHEGLEAVADEVMAVSEDTPSQQAVAQLRVLFRDKVIPLREDIERLGIDVAAR
jgi:hypothetical protein